MKLCRKCHLQKPLEAFYRAKNTKDGRATQCKACRDAVRKDQRSKPEVRAHYTATHRAWMDRHPGKEREYGQRQKAERPLVYLCKLARSRAKQLGVPFTIKTSDLHIPERCPLLNIVLESGANKVRPESPSIDRIDSTKGYEPGNVWIISYRANTIKNNATLAELEMLTRNLRQQIVGTL